MTHTVAALAAARGADTDALVDKIDANASELFGL
jgi:Tat protein secretion system quality control protein TatD with DNase activity